MAGRLVALCSIVLALGLSVGCGSKAELSSIQVTPGSADVSGPGATAQFKAVGTYTNGKNGNSYNQDLTTQVNWSSSSTAVATVNSSGLATAVAAGVTTITATGGNGGIVGTADMTVENGSGTGHDLTSITIIPNVQALTQQNETAQFIAIGTYTGSPATQDLTDQVTWSSSDVNVATINSSGLATSVNFGETTITALATVNGGAAITGTAALTVNSSGGGNGLPTLTVYKVGQGTGTVTSSPSGINCGSGASCTGNFQLNAPVTLTAVPAQGSTFGGWSANCTPTDQPTCTVTMIDNQTVGAIFNVQ